MSKIIFSDDTKPVIEYFERVWLGRQGLRAPLFPHEMWNCYESVSANLPRTNNAIEGWHSGFNSMVKANPLLWSFIHQLKQEQSKNQMLMRQILTGGESQIKKKKYKDVDLKIKKIVSNYRRENIMDFLNGIS